MGFPQELDDDYLVVWEGFDDKPWDYLLEDELRDWLDDRILEGFSFPLNPVWPIRDDGWFEVWQSLCAGDTKGTCDSWYPPESGIREKIQKIHETFPNGFDKYSAKVANSNTLPSDMQNRMSVIEDVDSQERAILLLQKAEKQQAVQPGRRAGA